MPSTYRGQPGNIARPSTLTIVSATNASPIVCGTSGAHGLTNGDVVDNYNGQGNTAVNGRWAITVVDSAHFSLATLGGVASVGNGTYSASSANAIVLTLGANYQVPSDGDTLNAASVSPQWTAMGDRTELLALNAPAAGANLYYFYNFNSAPGASLPQWASGSAGTLASQMTFTSGGANILWTATGINSGDLLECELSSNFQSSAAAGRIYLATSAYGPGASPPSPAELAGSMSVPFGTTPSRVSLGGVLTASFPSGIRGGNVDLSLWNVTSTGSATLAGFGDYLVKIKVWRPNL
jgi:hypothetical protein